MDTENMSEYLEHSTYIDCHEPSIQHLAKELKGAYTRDSDIAKKCFEYVRDEIKHSWDFAIDTITCKASDVLKYRTGYCYAKSHLLAALLRANHIPAGLCYQRLSIEGGGAPYCLHGLNAMHLSDIGWYRVDARGNKLGVNAQFSPPQEQLAFSTSDKYEGDIAGIWAKPFDCIIDVLTHHNTCQAVYDHLPDRTI